MTDKEKFSWRKRGRAFLYAWQGLKSLIVYEHNARIHLAVAMAVILAGIMFQISALEWAAVVICIGMVIAAEALNSAVEAVADRLTSNPDPLICRAKDYGALAVALLSLSAVIVGGIVFIPYIVSLFL